MTPLPRRPSTSKLIARLCILSLRRLYASRRAQLEAQLPAGHPSLRPQKLTPRLSEEWNTMTPEERRPFETIASEQARQTEEGPKHNSWHMFMYQRRPYLEDACRDTTGRVNQTKLIGILNEQWRRMTDEEKAPYVLQAQHSRYNDGNSILLPSPPIKPDFPNPDNSYYGENLPAFTITPPSSAPSPTDIIPPSASVSIDYSSSYEAAFSSSSASTNPPTRRWSSLSNWDGCESQTHSRRHSE
ncbi:uncharacterized protein STEHIDRAFT_109632 [Stereum hirsutum FP-91666 SS1]|uniref:uncharacterized protein n=1 Tax=Stereum hirsutum (strain FP-91666) TaxID=721885 RepID=UPI000440A8EF|nr:uncharacterized protein STEHIDRAFT_109632 [Stereum hirsutum FP-91666 SS1]EIM87740.1 hypothetical protein STEHIDRAFT_109632 [Stereum hirsutum FP-91666 SS1]